MKRRESRDTSPASTWRTEYGPVSDPQALSTDELEEELTIAAYAPGRIRFARYERLLAERRRRLVAA